LGAVVWEEVMDEAQLLPTVWLMFTADGFYPIQPSTLCKPEDHGALNDHVTRIEDADGKVLWRRVIQ
jgi:hypothetical protein